MTVRGYTIPGGTPIAVYCAVVPTVTLVAGLVFFFWAPGAGMDMEFFYTVGAGLVITVHDLVRRGRTPHQSALQQWSKADAEAVARALDLTGMAQNANRPLDTLSGGQRQRAWIAMALAQDTDILLLDEPTTYLDLPHQIELLNLVQQLNRDTGRTVAMVLHDINLAARFADHVVALKDGRVRVEGAPADAITGDMMVDIFNLSCTVIADPVHGHPHVIPA